MSEHPNALNGAMLGLGAFLMAGLLSLGVMAIKLGGLSLGDDRYELRARFVSASGLLPGAHVELAGVRVGEVATIRFDPESYQAEVALRIDDGIEIQDDAIASIRTAGIIGDKFLKISPGASDVILGPGEEILDTEPSVNLEELLAKYVFESGAK